MEICPASESGKATMDQLAKVTATYAKLVKRSEAIPKTSEHISKMSENTRSSSVLRNVSVVGLHKQSFPNRAYMFIILVSYADGSHVTLYRKYKTISLLQDTLYQELRDNPAQTEASYFLSKLRRRTIMRHMTSSVGTTRRLRMIDVINVYFQALVYYFNDVNYFSSLQNFFSLTQEDGETFDWCKNGKTFFYVTKSLLNRSHVTIEDHDESHVTQIKQKSKEDIIAALSRAPSIDLPLVARKSGDHPCLVSSSDNPDNADMYEAIDTHEPRDIDKSHDVLELKCGEKVEVLSKSETGWWFVKKEKDDHHHTYGYVPASYLRNVCAKDHDLIDQTKLTSSDESENAEPTYESIRHHPKILPRCHTADPIVTSLTSHNKDNNEQQCDYITTKAYVAQSADELSFGANVTIEVLEKRPDGWWKGRYKGKVGLVPGIFLKQHHDLIRRFSLQLSNLQENLQTRRRKLRYETSKMI